MNYLVTGGAGFIGGHLVERLVADGHQVRIIDDFSSGNPDNLVAALGGYELFNGSILDLDLVAHAMQGVQGVFHMAAIANVQESIRNPQHTQQVNAQGALNVFLAAQEQGARVVFSSSSAVYGDDPEQPKRETMLPFPVSPYAVQKLNGEHYLRTFARLHSLECFCLRYFNVYGPRQNPFSEYAAVVPKFIHRALSGQSPIIFGDGEQTRDFIYVADVVEANLCAMKAPNAQGQALNIGSGSSISLNELVQAILTKVAPDIEVEYQPARPGDILHSSCDPSEGRKNINFSARTALSDGLDGTIAFWKEKMKAAIS